MQDATKNLIQTQRPKVKRVYVLLKNPDNEKDRKHFTAYGLTVKELMAQITGQKPSPNRAA